MKKYVETVSRGLTLRGFLEVPEGSTKPPLLIMFHGFTGSKSEKHFLLSRLSAEVVKSGTATLRFDFGGTAESDGDFQDVTPLTEIVDGENIIRFAQGLDEIDGNRLSLLGYSLGGFVAANVAGRMCSALEKLILVSPAVATHKKMERMYLETGSCGRGSLVLTKKFFEDGNAIDVMNSSRYFKGKVTIIQGTIDTAVAPETALQYKNNFANASLHYIEGAVHAYDTPEHYEALCGCVISAVRE